MLCEFRRYLRARSSVLCHGAYRTPQRQWPDDLARCVYSKISIGTEECDLPQGIGPQYHNGCCHASLIFVRPVSRCFPMPAMIRLQPAVRILTLEVSADALPRVP